MVFSFFEEKQHLTHFATEQDIADEFIALLSEAKDFYLQDVIVNGKRYDRYVDDFCKQSPLHQLQRRSLQELPRDEHPHRQGATARLCRSRQEVLYCRHVHFRELHETEVEVRLLRIISRQSRRG